MVIKETTYTKKPNALVLTEGAYTKQRCYKLWKEKIELKISWSNISLVINVKWLNSPFKRKSCQITTQSETVTYKGT